MLCPVPARQFTIVAAASFAFLSLDVDIACGFFKEIFMTLACDMAPQMAIVIPFAVGTMPFAGVAFSTRP
jgi:hypothetical protein